MKITLSTNQVAEELIQDFNANLSWEMAIEIAEHLKKIEEETGVEIELDFKAICCHFLRFDSMEEWAMTLPLRSGKVNIVNEKNDMQETSGVRLKSDAEIRDAVRLVNEDQETWRSGPCAIRKLLKILEIE